MAIINIEEIARETALAVATSLEATARLIRAQHASANEEAITLAPTAPAAAEPEQDAVEPEPAKPRRKRRTKAEIEADKAAADAEVKPTEDDPEPAGLPTAADPEPAPPVEEDDWQPKWE